MTRHINKVAVMAVAMVMMAAPASAQDRCEALKFGLLPGGVGMCHAYCTHLDCDNIFDGDPLCSPQASQNACGNIAVSLMSMLEGLARSEINPAVAHGHT